ncbi:MAG: class I SAM-dependent methyltransferase [Pedobacter sp.]
MISWNSIDCFRGNHTDPKLVEHRDCPVCGADRVREILSMSDFQFFSDRADQPKRVDIRQVQCQKCFALYLDPAYSLQGFEILFAEAGCSYGATAGRAQEQLEWLSKNKLLEQNRSLLDVGCFEGRFLSMMPDTVKRIGVDIDGPAIERGRKNLAGKDVLLIQGDFNQVKLPMIPDTITMFHVLEHLPDPLSTLKNLRNQSNEKTRLVVEVPILEKGFTNDINGFFSVQHMTHFSRASLSNILQRAGWVIEDRLEQNGYNGCRVLCRPSNMRETVDITQDDCLTIEKYLEHYPKAVEAVCSSINQVPEIARIVIWGGGLHTEFLYHWTNLFNSPGREFVIIDKDPLKQGQSWRGINIYGPNILNDIKDPNAFLVISSYANQEEIGKEVEANWHGGGKTLKLYNMINIY